VWYIQPAAAPRGQTSAYIRRQAEYGLLQQRRGGSADEQTALYFRRCADDKLFI